MRFGDSNLSALCCDRVNAPHRAPPTTSIDLMRTRSQCISRACSLGRWLCVVFRLAGVLAFELPAIGEALLTIFQRACNAPLPKRANVAARYVVDSPQQEITKHPCLRLAFRAAGSDHAESIERPSSTVQCTGDRPSRPAWRVLPPQTWTSRSVSANLHWRHGSGCPKSGAWLRNVQASAASSQARHPEGRPNVSEALGEPAVDLGEQLVGGVTLALALPQAAAELHGGRSPGLGLLAAGDARGLAEKQASASASFAP